jgi:hypothetical protein
MLEMGRVKASMRLTSRLMRGLSGVPSFQVEVPTYTGQETVYSGWRSVVKKHFTYGTGKVKKYDIMTQGAPSVLVVPWCTESRTTTLLREWQPGTDRVLWGVVAGMVEEEAVHGSHGATTGAKHSGPLQAGQYELDEEAHLLATTWIPLSSSAAPADKYSDNVFHAYLAMDLSAVASPRPLDDSESIEIHPGKT